MVALATCFENVAGGVLPLESIIQYPSAADKAANATFSSADQIWRFNTSSTSWTKYYLFNNRGTFYWAAETDTKQVKTDVGQSVTFATGETFFFVRGAKDGTLTLTLSGGVKAFDGNASFAVTASQLAFACNPWPVDLPIKNFKNFYDASGADGAASATMSAADQVWLWNASTTSWTKYYYYLNRGSKYFVCETQADKTKETEQSIPSGTGFFFSRGGTDMVNPAIIKITMQ